MPLRLRVPRQRLSEFQLPILPFLAPRVFSPWPKFEPQQQQQQQRRRLATTAKRGGRKQDDFEFDDDYVSDSFSYMNDYGLEEELGRQVPNIDEIRRERRLARKPGFSFPENKEFLFRPAVEPGTVETIFHFPEDETKAPLVYESPSDGERQQEDDLYYHTKSEDWLALKQIENAFYTGIFLDPLEEVKELPIRRLEQKDAEYSIYSPATRHILRTRHEERKPEYWVPEDRESLIRPSITSGTVETIVHYPEDEEEENKEFLFHPAVTPGTVETVVHHSEEKGQAPLVYDSSGDRPRKKRNARKKPVKSEINMRHQPGKEPHTYKSYRRPNFIIRKQPYSYRRPSFIIRSYVEWNRSRFVRKFDESRLIWRSVLSPFISRSVYRRKAKKSGRKTTIQRNVPKGLANRRAMINRQLPLRLKQPRQDEAPEHENDMLRSNTMYRSIIGGRVQTYAHKRPSFIIRSFVERNRSRIIRKFDESKLIWRSVLPSVIWRSIYRSTAEKSGRKITIQRIIHEGLALRRAVRYRKLPLRMRLSRQRAAIEREKKILRSNTIYRSIIGDGFLRESRPISIWRSVLPWVIWRSIYIDTAEKSGRKTTIRRIVYEGFANRRCRGESHHIWRSVLPPVVWRSIYRRTAEKSGKKPTTRRIAHEGLAIHRCLSESQYIWRSVLPPVVWRSIYRRTAEKSGQKPTIRRIVHEGLAIRRCRSESHHIWRSVLPSVVWRSIYRRATEKSGRDNTAQERTILICKAKREGRERNTLERRALRSNTILRSVLESKAVKSKIRKELRPWTMRSVFKRDRPILARSSYGRTAGKSGRPYTVRSILKSRNQKRRAATIRLQYYEDNMWRKPSPEAMRIIMTCRQRLNAIGRLRSVKIEASKRDVRLRLEQQKIRYRHSELRQYDSLSLLGSRLPQGQVKLRSLHQAQSMFDKWRSQPDGDKFGKVSLRQRLPDGNYRLRGPAAVKRMLEQRYRPQKTGRRRRARKSQTRQDYVRRVIGILERLPDGSHKLHRLAASSSNPGRSSHPRVRTRSSARRSAPGSSSILNGIPDASVVKSMHDRPRYLPLKFKNNGAWSRYGSTSILQNLPDGTCRLRHAATVQGVLERLRSAWPGAGSPTRQHLRVGESILERLQRLNQARAAARRDRFRMKSITRRTHRDVGQSKNEKWRGEHFWRTGFAGVASKLYGDVKFWATTLVKVPKQQRTWSTIGNEYANMLAKLPTAAEVMSSWLHIQQEQHLQRPGFDVWSATILQVLQEHPYHGLKILVGSYDPRVPAYAVADCLEYLTKLYCMEPDESIRTNNVMAALEVACHMRLQHGEENFLTQVTIFNLVKYAKPVAIAPFYHILRACNQKLKDNTLLHFAYRLGTDGDTASAMDVLDILHERGTSFHEPKVESVCAQILYKSGSDDAEASDGISRTDAFNRMLEYGLRPNIIFYGVFIRKAIQFADPETAWSIHDMMLETGIAPNAHTLSMLLNDAKQRADREAVQRIYDIVESTGNLDAHLITDLLHALFVLENVPGDHLSKMDRRWELVYGKMLPLYAKYFDIRPFKLLGDTHLRHSTRQVFQDLYAKTLDDEPKPQASPATMTTMMLAMIQADGTVGLYREFQKLVLERNELIMPLTTSTRVYNGFVQLFTTKIEWLSLCTKVITDMLSRNKILGQSVPAETHASIESCKPDVRTWSILLKGFVRHQQITAAQRVLNLMKEHHIKPDDVTWNTLLKGLAQAQDIPAAVETVRRLEEEGYTTDRYTIRALSKIDNTAGLRSALERMEIRRQRQLDTKSAKHKEFDRTKVVRSDLVLTKAVDRISTRLTMPVAVVQDYDTFKKAVQNVEPEVVEKVIDSRTLYASFDRSDDDSRRGDGDVVESGVFEDDAKQDIENSAPRTINLEKYGLSEDTANDDHGTADQEEEDDLLDIDDSENNSAFYESLQQQDNSSLPISGHKDVSLPEVMHGRDMHEQHAEHDSGAR